MDSESRRKALIVHPEFAHMLEREPEKPHGLEDLPANALLKIALLLSGDARDVLRLELVSKTCR